MFWDNYEQLLSVSADWEKPPLGWVKLNTDGSLFEHQGKAAAGGVVRDDEGRWLTGFAMKINTPEIVVAELLDLREGLKLAWERRFESIEIECDSKVVVDLINNANVEDHPLGLLVEDCRELLHQPWNCTLRHVHRERNTLADRMAKLGQVMEEGRCTWDYPPPPFELD